MPPSQVSVPIIASKLVSTPNPDLEPHNLPAMAAHYLHPQPFGSVRITCPHRLIELTTK